MIFKTLPKQLLLGGLGVALATLPVVGQTSETETDTKSQSSLRISVTEAEGNVSKTTESIVPLEGQTLEAIIQELGVLNNWNLSEGGDEIEIEIRKRTTQQPEGERIVIQMQFPDNVQQKMDEMVENQLARIEAEMEQQFNRPLLGVYTHSADGGARISRIVPNSGAQAAGLQAGDVILAMDDQPVTHHRKLTDIIRSHQPGDEVAIQIQRDGKTEMVNATLGKQPVEDLDFDFDFDFDFQDDNINYEYRYENNNNQTSQEDAMEQGFLGVMLQDGHGTGVAVLSVYAQSAALEMGLQSGDQILSINGQETSTLNELIQRIREVEPGDDFNLMVVRDDKEMEMSGTMKSKAATLTRNGNGQIAPKGSSEAVEERKVVVKMWVEDMPEEEEEEWLEQTQLPAAPKLDINDVSFAPNPNFGQFRLTFDLASEGETVLQIIDANGSPIRRQNLGYFTGPYRESFDIMEQPAGLYFLTITQNGQRFVKKIVKK